MIVKRQIGKSLEFTTNNGFVIIKTSKEDLPNVNNRFGLDMMPATYVVFGDYIKDSQKRIGFYVGESSTNVVSRLKESFSKRPWINEIFLILSPQGYLTMEIVKTLEFMIFQTLNNCMFGIDDIKIQADNSINGVIGYRVRLGDDNYSSLTNDIFTLFFQDAFLYSKYKFFFNDFIIQPTLLTNSKVIIDKRFNELRSCITIDKSIEINKNSIITIDNYTIANSSDEVKGLMRNLLANKLIYPIIRNNNINWCFCDTTRINKNDLDKFVVLCCNSLIANSNNSMMDYKRFIKIYSD